jgi:hypothetical protein
MLRVIFVTLPGGKTGGQIGLLVARWKVDVNCAAAAAAEVL